MKKGIKERNVKENGRKKGIRERRRNITHLEVLHLNENENKRSNGCR